MAKKKGGKSKGNISQGIHQGVSTRTRREVRQAVSSGDKLINKLDAFRAGKDVVVTIKNPNENETNKPYIRVKYSGKEYLAAIKKRQHASQVKL